MSDDDYDGHHSRPGDTKNSGRIPGGNWDELKRSRNRINSQRTRERERAQIDGLEVDRARLWLSNDALRFQNHCFRDAMQQIRELKTESASAPSDQNKPTVSKNPRQGGLLLSPFLSMGAAVDEEGALRTAPGGHSSLNSLLATLQQAVVGQAVQTPQAMVNLILGNDNITSGNVPTDRLGSNSETGRASIESTLGVNQVGLNSLLSSPSVIAPLLGRSAAQQLENQYPFAEVNRTTALYGLQGISQQGQLSNAASRAKNSISSGQPADPHGLTHLAALLERRSSEASQVDGLLEEIRKYQSNQS